jgi:hypothetical protein
MKQQYLSQAKRLYDRANPSEGIDSMNFPIEMENLILCECQEHNESTSNANTFITGALDYYHEHGALTNRQWYHVIKFWLRLHWNELQSLEKSLEMIQQPRLKHMLDQIKDKSNL